MARDGLSVVAKATLILERFLTERTTSLGFNEILSGTGLSRATAHRLLADMTAHGLLSQDARRDEYRLGPLLLSTGELARHSIGLAEVAAPRLEALRDEFGETTLLAELHGGSVVPIRRLDGLHEMRMSQEVGRRYPAYAGATGQVLLAHLRPEELAAYLARVELVPLTDDTIRSPAGLRSVLGRVRGAGVGVSVGERVPDAIAISAPVFDRDGSLAGALTVSGVAGRWDRGLIERAARAVKAAAEAVSGELGAPLATASPGAADLEDPGSEASALLAQACDEAASKIDQQPRATR
ncbi:MAG: IclR family transcriptional regulator [Syntrophothermus sp.]